MLSSAETNPAERPKPPLARMSWVLIAVVATLALMPAASQASLSRSCAPIRPDLSYAVKIERGSARCATARRVLQTFLVGFHRARVRAWTCTLVRYGAACFRGGRNRSTARDYVTALTNPKTADDPAAAELARTAQTAAETMATDNNGSYSNVSPATLRQTEPTIPITARVGRTYLSAAASIDAGRGYTVTATAPSRDTYTITRTPTGSIARSCTVADGGTSGGLCHRGRW
jgi:hypothetical protein